MEHNHDTEHTTTHKEAQTSSAAKTGSPAWFLPASILAAAILISGSLIYMTHSNPGAPSGVAPTEDEASVTVTAPAAEERDVILGNPDAPVSIVQYEDFQCPFCGQYAEETESQIRQAYVESGKVKIVYRHFAFLGPESFASAEASECAKDQGKFWEFHDAIFAAETADGKEHNGNLNRALFVKIAKDLQIDEAKFASCYDAGTYKAFVEKSAKDASAKYGVQSTPTIFVNDQKVEGAYPFSAFQEIIEGILNK